MVLMVRNRWIGLSLFFIASSAFLYASYEWVKRPPVVASPEFSSWDLIELTRRLAETHLTPGSVSLNKLKSLKIDSNSINEASFWAARLLTTEKTSPPTIRFQHPAWRSATEDESGETAVIMREWHKHAQTNQLAEFILEMYESNYGSAREILLRVARSRPTVPYIDVMSIQAISDLFGKSVADCAWPHELPEETKVLLRRLYSGEKIYTWIHERKKDLRLISGGTHTILGVYDWISYPKFKDKTGYSSFPDHADAYYDLGGGFATPDIDRVLHQNFESLDIVNPRDANSKQIKFQVLKNWTKKFGLGELRPETQREHAVYLKELEKTPWQNFDIFRNHFRTDLQTYFITSFGFLSSTVVSESAISPETQEGNAYFFVTLQGLKLVMELVALNKDVSLFTYQRASARPYRFRTIFLRFQNQKLVVAKIFPGFHQKPGVSQSSFIERIGE